MASSARVESVSDEHFTERPDAANEPSAPFSPRSPRQGQHISQRLNFADQHPSLYSLSATAQEQLRKVQAALKGQSTMPEQAKRDTEELQRYREKEKRQREKRKRAREQHQARGPLNTGIKFDEAFSEVVVNSDSEPESPRPSTANFNHGPCPRHGSHHAPTTGTNVNIDGDQLIINGTVHKISNLAQRTLTLTKDGVMVGDVPGKKQVVQQQKGTQVFHYIGIFVVAMYVLGGIFGGFSIEIG